MTAWPILSLVTFLPLVGVLLILPISDDGENARRNIRIIALATTVATFVVSLFIWTGFDNSQAGFQFVEKYAWLDSGISYHMGVDGISMLFVILTTFLMPLCILASWESVEKRVKAYMIAFLLLWWLIHSPWGKAFTALRDNPIRAESLGVNIQRYTLLAFAIGMRLSRRRRRHRCRREAWAVRTMRRRTTMRDRIRTARQVAGRAEGWLRRLPTAESAPEGRAVSTLRKGRHCPSPL